MTLSPRFPRWFLASAALLLLGTAAAAALLAGAGAGGDPSRAAYERVRIGMARPEAEAAFGDWPHAEARAGAGWVTVGWEAPDGATIEVDFDARSRVTGKHIAETDSWLVGEMHRLASRVRLR
jgi:hypothetical protein